MKIKQLFSYCGFSAVAYFATDSDQELDKITCVFFDSFGEPVPFLTDGIDDLTKILQIQIQKYCRVRHLTIIAFL